MWANCREFNKEGAFPSSNRLRICFESASNLVRRPRPSRDSYFVLRTKKEGAISSSALVRRPRPSRYGYFAVVETSPESRRPSS